MTALKDYPIGAWSNHLKTQRLGYHPVHHELVVDIFASKSETFIPTPHSPPDAVFG